MVSLNRRQFLSLTGGAAAGVVASISFGPLPADALAALQQRGQSSGGRVLIVVDMQGGNDALNTMVPNSGKYYDLRPTLALNENELITFRGLECGVHPGLESLRSLWDAGQFTAIYGTGLEGQGRSHFVAQDAWRTARPERPSQSGWIGRWLETSFDENSSPLRAIALGQSALAAQGEFVQPVAIQSVAGFELASPAVARAVLAMSDGPGEGVFRQAQESVPQTVAAANQLEGLLASIGLEEDADPDADASLFAATQAIIQGDAGAEVIYVTINGFDTHALQQPRQDLLLRLVADGLSDLFAALEESGHAENTLAMVVSEFGRRGAENGAAGTDHGRGGLSFLIGPPVRTSTVIGEPDLDDLINGDLRITTDARTIYDSALRWLGATDSQVVEVLGDEWKSPRLLKA